jgi:hypothetical protein
MIAERIAEEACAPGERLLWSGFPRPKSAAIGAIPGTVFGLLFAGFAAFWISAAAASTSQSVDFQFPGSLFPLFGVPFLLIGIGLPFSPLWGYRNAKHTVYAVTDRRVFIASGTRTRTAAYLGSRNMQRGPRVTLVGIPGVRSVEELIRENLLRRAT